MTSKLIAFVCWVLVLNFVSGFRGGGGHFNGQHHGHHYGGHYGHYGGYHGHYGQHHWHHRHEPLANFEVHEPRGLTVSMVQRSPNCEFFGIELFINRNPERYSGTYCDVCQNTTTVTYGKFILMDELVVIKKGDVLYYRIFTDSRTCGAYSRVQELQVTESHISKCNCGVTSKDPDIDVRFLQPVAETNDRPSYEPKLPQATTYFPPRFDEQSNTESSGLYPNQNIGLECEVDPATSLCRTAKNKNLCHSDRDLDRQLEMMEAVVEKMRNSDTTTLVRLEKFDSDIVNTDQLTDYASSSLSADPEMRPLANKIRRVLQESGSPRVILLDMSSYADKQKLLYLAQKNNLVQISDYDERF